MIAFEVHRNNQRVCVAGVGELGVLTAIVNWVARSAEKLQQLKAEGHADLEPNEMTLEVGGFVSIGQHVGRHTRWCEESLRVGDEVRIRVIDAARVDPPTTEYSEDPANDLERRKAYVRKLAAELGWGIQEPDSV
jgi:hypothetical protein